MKVLHSICQQIWKTQQRPQDWKRSVFIPITKKGNTKECSSYRTVALISHASKEMFKILQIGLQQYMNWEIPDAQAGFRKGRGTRKQIANIHWIIEKATEFQKNIYFCFIDRPKPLTVWMATNYGNFKITPYLPPEKLYAGLEAIVRIRHGTTTGSKLWREYIKAVYWSLFMQRTSYEMPCWIKHKLESKLLGEISITLDMQITPLLWQKVKRN